MYICPLLPAGTRPRPLSSPDCLTCVEFDANAAHVRQSGPDSSELAHERRLGPDSRELGTYQTVRTRFERMWNM